MIICLDQRSGAGCGTENTDGAAYCRSCGMGLRFALPLRAPGATVGAYRIVRLIGHGACGAVYQAEDLRQPDAHVAIKETFDPASIAVFQSEFSVLSTLQHDNLPGYFEMFEADGNGYLVMEFVPGQSLQDVLDQQSAPLPESQVLGYALQLCDVLGYLHARRPPILHRDLKPANIRLTPEGRIKLVDFGLLKQGTQQTRMTIRGLGTPAYAPIEQYGRGSTDPRSDLYSLGATLYHLFTGVEPPPATDRIASDPDPLLPPRRANPSLTSPVVDALVTALAVMQRDRYADAAAFKSALVRGVSVAPSTHREPPPTSPPPRRQPVLRPPINRQPPAPPKPSIYAALDRRLSGHKGAVTSVAWSPDADLLASAGDDQVIRLWNAADGELVRSLRGHQDTVWSVAFAPDGRYLASASADKTLRLWRVTDEYPLHLLEGHSGKIISVAWSPDGRMLASGGWDGAVCLWSTTDGALLHMLKGHTGWIYHVAWSPDGQMLASASADRTVRLWPMTKPGQSHVLEGHTDEVTALTFNPDGRTLASSGDDQTVRIWQVTTGALLETTSPSLAGIRSIAFSPDGKLIAAGTLDQKLAIWPLADSQQIKFLQQHQRGVWSVAWRPDGQRLASASEDRTVALWRVSFR